MSKDDIMRPIEELRGVGPKIAAALRAKGMHTLEDLLYLVPSRYIDRRVITPIAGVSAGEHHNIVAVVTDYRSLYFRHARKKAYEAIVEDESGAISVKWFQWSRHYLKEICKKGNLLFLSGQVTQFGERLQMVHPEIAVMDDIPHGGDLKKIVPVYSAVEGVGQGVLRKIIGEALRSCDSAIVSICPAEIESKHDFPALGEALESVHLPHDEVNLTVDINRWRQRLILEEYLLFQAALCMEKSGRQGKKGIIFTDGGPLTKRFFEHLDFELTGAQKRVIDEIRADMSSSSPMGRLLQGDVGSGKTICAVLAACIAVDNGYQAVFMAPTEILAEQHYFNIHTYFTGLDVPVAFLKGNMGSHRRGALDDIKKGSIPIIVGTHALIQDDVVFHKLGLAIIDEQHRFGVLQRRLLVEKAAMPDVLMMTATPIPRTLSMIIYGDLDVSLIDEMPKGRHPVKTRVFTEDDKQKVYDLVEGEMRKGRQAYIVYPLAEESEKMLLLDATKMARHFQDGVFAERRVELLHGSMKASDKEEVMRRFKKGLIDILVCTTVVEVGIDVPNASIIVVEHAERFGLSQLHQLRGRVGRGAYPSMCCLITASKRSETATKRLRTMEKTADGFIVAEEDMKIRGVGDMLGVRQSGIPDFRIGDILKDMPLMLQAKAMAREIISGADRDGLESIREMVRNRWDRDFSILA